MSTRTSTRGSGTEIVGPKGAYLTTRLRTLGEHRSLTAGLLILAAVVFLALAGENLTPFDPTRSFVSVGDRTYSIPPLLPPGSTVKLEGQVELLFVLGTDHLGRDVLSRIVSGARFVLTVALVATAISAAIGVTLGLLSGYMGGALDRAVSLVMDSMYAFPGLVLAIAVAALLGTGILNMATAIAVVYIPSYYRMVRSAVLSLKSLPFVDALRVMGMDTPSILFRHIAPNALYSIIAVLPVNFADAVITEAALSFLGLGISPPTPDWGYDLNTGRRYFLSGHWWIGAFPGMMIVLTVLGFLLVGEGLGERFNPRRLIRR